ncbi:hypothetical protein AVEN_69762-1 [Araneus ventricosus]|uniref:Uncharacterized protein n=1 Tax=Araneus ventricosus TaxID=182803 RepID=A0A4Y2CVM7_ARAVE|nr:hypothetical protein AVEN_69762-1 [Araneus ventricosus]
MDADLLRSIPESSSSPGLCNSSYLRLIIFWLMDGRGWTTPWTPRSPEITPLDLFLLGEGRGYIKKAVFTTPVHNNEALKDRITEVMSSVLQSKWWTTRNEN